MDFTFVISLHTARGASEALARVCSQKGAPPRPLLLTFMLPVALVHNTHARCIPPAAQYAYTRQGGTLVAKRDIAGARNLSLTFPSLASFGHITSFGLAVREKPISAVVSQIVATSAADCTLMVISCLTCAIVRSTSPLLKSSPSVIYRGSAAVCCSHLDPVTWLCIVLMIIASI